MLAALIGAGPVDAQPPTPTPAPAVQPAPPPTPATTPPPAVTESKPEVYYLRDKSGALVPVVGYSLEQFEEMLKQGKTTAAPPAPPPYRIDRLAATGRAGTDRVELTVDITLAVEQPGWVAVPLRLKQAVLRADPRHDGAGEFFLSFDEAAGEYVAWIRDGGTEPHQLHLELAAPLGRSGQRATLELSFPRALQATFELDVPAARAHAEVLSGGTLDAAEAVDDHTRFRFSAVSSSFSAAWTVPEMGPKVRGPSFESTAEILVHLDATSVRHDADISVWSFEGEFDQFRVRLPDGAALLHDDAPDYQVFEVAGPEGGTPSAPGAKEAPAKSASAWVEVRLAAPTLGPVTVRLSTERPQAAGAAASPAMFDLGGFAVEGALRQSGHVAVEAAGEWQVIWGTRRGIQQVEKLPDALWNDQVVAGFEFYAQPFTLEGRVTPRETRISVEPEYVVQVSPRRLELEARFKYRIAGAKVFALDIDFPGWQVDDVDPALLVNEDQLVLGQTRPLTVPLLRPSIGEFELVVRAHQDVPDAARTLDFLLPAPQAGVVGTGRLLVVPADSLELAPREADLVGLVRQRQRVATGDPRPGEQPPLSYRTEAGPGRFVADFRTVERTIDVELESQVTLTTQGGAVRQRYTWTVAHEAVEALQFDAPRLLVESGVLQVRVEGTPVHWVAVDAAPTDDEQATRIRAALPAPKLGRFELTVEYPVVFEELVPQASVVAQIPLVMPADGALARQELVIDYAEELEVRPLEGQWTKLPATAEDLGRGRVARFTTAGTRGNLPLAIQFDERRSQRSLVVERAWVQTWCGDGTRQDRVCLRFTGSGRWLRMIVPTGGRLERIWLDGQPVKTLEGQTPNELGISLDASDDPDRPRTLELWYRFVERPIEAWGRQRFELPQFDGVRWVHQLQWQLVLPPDEHLLLSDGRHTPEHGWIWTAMGWRRQPLRSTAELEAWAGGQSVGGPSDQGFNTYLFSSMGQPEPLVVWTVRRGPMVLAASGAALAVGFLLLYFPWTRHPAVGLLGAVLLLAASLVAPEATLVVAQAAALGLLLAVLAGVLSHLVSQRGPRGRTGRGAPSAMGERSSVRSGSAARLSAGASATTTIAAPVPHVEGGGG